MQRQLLIHFVSGYKWFCVAEKNKVLKNVQKTLIIRYTTTNLAYPK